MWSVRRNTSTTSTFRTVLGWLISSDLNQAALWTYLICYDVRCTRRNVACSSTRESALVKVGLAMYGKSRSRAAHLPLAGLCRSKHANRLDIICITYSAHLLPSLAVTYSLPMYVETTASSRSACVEDGSGVTSSCSLTPQSTTRFKDLWYCFEHSPYTP